MFKLAGSQASLFSDLLAETPFNLTQQCRRACVALACADIALCGRNYLCMCSYRIKNISFHIWVPRMELFIGD